MDEVRYTISEAAKKLQVESHVLRYWEEELGLKIGRTDMGHRFYTNDDIQLFLCIQKLKNEGMLLRDLKFMIPELTAARKRLNSARSDEKKTADIDIIMQACPQADKPIEDDSLNVCDSVSYMWAGASSEDDAQAAVLPASDTPADNSTLNSVTPETVNPESMSPDSAQSAASAFTQPVTSKSMSSESAVSKSTVSESAAPKSKASESTILKSTAPKSAAPGAATPKPAALNSIASESAASESKVPEHAASKFSVPEPAALESKVPEPTALKPTVSEAAALKPAASGADVDVIQVTQLEQVRSLIGDVLTEVVSANNETLKKDISRKVTADVIREMDFLFQANERREEEHYRKLDTLIRQQQASRREAARETPLGKLKKLLT